MKLHNYYVYILTNRNKSVLYVGVTNDIVIRLQLHSEGKIYGFTRKYNCHYLIYYECYDDVKDAIAREKEIKGWIRKKKEQLISTKNPEWLFLNDTFIEYTYLSAYLSSDKAGRAKMEK